MSQTVHETTDSAAVARYIDAACDRIAPTWPLDQFIAVNPYWGWRTSPIEQCAAMLGTLADTVLTMPRAWFAQQRMVGAFNDDDIQAAAEAAGDPTLAIAARLALSHTTPSDPVVSRLPLVTDLCDRIDAPRAGQRWTDHVTHEISQHCGAHFDEAQASWQPDHSVDLFTRWRDQHSVVHGVAWHRGRGRVREQLNALPTDPSSAIEFVLADLQIDDAGAEAYLSALLLSINGWASWCAYRRWQARLDQSDDHEIVALLAVRISWEWLLHHDHDAHASAPTSTEWIEWAASWSNATELADSLAAEQRVDWVLQAAAERSHQNAFIGALTNSATPQQEQPAVQAVFCIDVRSEVFRRAFESVTSAVQTRGFAGFFGLPISYTPVASGLTRPQLPGLLAPALNVTDALPEGSDAIAVAEERGRNLERGQRWSAFRSAPSSVFSFVESMGLLYGAKLLKESLPHVSPTDRWEHHGISESVRDGLRPRLALVDDDPAAAAAIAYRVLRGMSLVDNFAPLIMLCGHGSQSANNPHAAGLDCGACGGQTGEVNARVLADLLNSSAVRSHLVPLGIEIPSGTWFVPALHNTTTDDVTLFDTALASHEQQGPLAALQTWLEEAGNRARADRAERLGYPALPPATLKDEIRKRANDWSQVRPEWGLAGNASFVVAPRSRTSGLNLDGRAFLHDYDWRVDPDLTTLTNIMTAPMIVTNWINMQYNASTVDNRRYGTGNKVLHNVVGGRIGVFEGNGGDLRIGLSMQSLHDGTTLRHPPLRLSVFIEAPRAGIDTVIGAHQLVQDLITNGWLHLFRIEPESGAVEQWLPAKSLSQTDDGPWCARPSSPTP